MPSPEKPDFTSEQVNLAFKAGKIDAATYNWLHQTLAEHNWKPEMLTWKEVKDARANLHTALEELEVN